MKSAVKFGLIGTAGFGKFHLQALQKLNAAGSVKLLAVADPNIQRHPDLLAEFKREGIRIYEDYSRMLDEEPTLQAVSIAAPIPYHFEIAKKCIEHSLFIYLEKPPTPLLEQFDQLVAADTNHRVAVGFQLIESSWNQTIKQWIVGGRLGDITEITTAACWPRSDSYYKRASWAGRMKIGTLPVFDGPATNALAHLIHSNMYFSGAELDEFGIPTEIQGELYRARPIESYDVCCLRGRFKSGIRCLAALTHATEHPLPFQMEIKGSKGWVRVSHDGDIFESNLETKHYTESFEDLVLKSFTSFVLFVKGERSRPGTRLRDARGYTLATNALLLSSNHIHDIGEPWCQAIETNKEIFYSVEGLHHSISNLFKAPRLFSEQGFPWAVSTSPVSTSHIETKHELIRRRMMQPARRRKPVPATVT